MSVRIDCRSNGESGQVRLSPMSDILTAIRDGRMVVLADDIRADSNAYLVMAAQMVTPAHVNFMATHGRGLVALALTQNRIADLGLAPIARRDDRPVPMVFAPSIEAREGVTTGISAADRARTIATAVYSTDPSRDLVTPGHVFPIVAQNGGVLTRAGPGEAAIDMARIAGLNPSAAICEILTTDGATATLPYAAAQAGRHRLQVGTIRDLISYRRRFDHLVQSVAEIEFESEFGGRWKAVTYYNGTLGCETLALVLGTIDPRLPVMVRMHAHSMTSDSLGGTGARRHLLGNTMRMITEKGSGIVVLVNDSTNVRRYSDGMAARLAGFDHISPKQWRLRDYGNGAQILADLGVERMILLTNSGKVPVALSGYGIDIAEMRRIPLTPI